MRPSQTLLVILGGYAVAALALVALRLWWPALADIATTAWWLAAGALLLAVLIDGGWPEQRQLITATRSMPGSLSLGVSNKVSIRISNALSRTVSIELVDLYPTQVYAQGLPLTLQLERDCHSDIYYHIYPLKRGDADFGQVQIRLRSRFKLWQFLLQRDAAHSVKIYPNFASIKHFQDLGHDQQINQLGMHRRQRRGEGMDFHQLREFREGDVLRQVDWKASARQRKLISREYQDERDQDIIFLLDCGRRMRTKDEELSHFDHALNAMLLTAYVALQQGDSVGVLTFAGQQRWLPPVKGKHTINTVLNHVYDIHSSTATSDFIEAAQQLTNRHRKRALVILLSNIRDDDQEDLLEAVRLLSRRHLVLVASLREQALQQITDRAVADFQTALDYAGTVHFLEERRQLLEQLRLHGAHIADTLPKHLHIELVNQYWTLKRSGLI